MRNLYAVHTETLWFIGDWNIPQGKISDFSKYEDISLN